MASEIAPYAVWAFPPMAPLPAVRAGMATVASVAPIPANRVILAVVTGSLSHVDLRFFKGNRIDESFVGCFGNCPFILRDGDFLLGLDTNLLGFAQNGIAQVHSVFQDTLYRCVVPNFRSSCSTFWSEIVTAHCPVFQWRHDSFGTQIHRDFDTRVTGSSPCENASNDWRCILVGY